MNVLKLVFVILIFQQSVGSVFSNYQTYFYNLLEDFRLLFKKQEPSQLLLNENVLPSFCGIANNTQSDNRIVGGQKANIEEYPWLISLQVKIGNKFRHNCGGTIVHKYYVLTAAHCVDKINIKLLRVAAMKTNLFEKEPLQQYRYPVQIFINEWNSMNFRNDFALLKMDKAFNDITPICIPHGNENFEDNALLAGWGRLSDNGLLPNQLYAVTLPLLSYENCTAKFRYTIYRSLLYKCNICTLSEEGKDGCQGDSGGPLMCTDGNSHRIYECGIVSWGVGCANLKYPGVYTKVACINQWIVDTIANN